MSKSVLVKIFDFKCMLFQEIGHRLAGRRIFVEPSDIYHCTWNEIISVLHGDWDGSELNVLVVGRKSRRKEMKELSPPDLIIDCIVWCHHISFPRDFYYHY